MSNKVRKFKDLDNSFKAHPVTGDIRTVTDEDAISQSIRNLIRTNFYEKPFHPEIGSNVGSLLFEQNIPIATNEIRNSIIEVINNYEPRAEIVDVQVYNDIDNYSYTANIEYRILNSQEPVELSVFLERIR